MPIRLADILKDTKTVTFSYEGEEVTVEYRHNALTPVLRIALAAGPTYFRARREPLEPAEPKGKGKKKPTPAQAAAERDRWWQDALAESLGYLDVLAKLLVSWDVLGDDGQPLPVSTQMLEQFPLSFINAIVGAILTDGLPNPQSGEDLPDTSPPTD